MAPRPSHAAAGVAIRTGRRPAHRFDWRIPVPGARHRLSRQCRRPITRVNWTSRQNASQLPFDCGGFTGGTSGSPWVTHFNTRTRNGTIVWVIGGYQEGGDTAAISYSSYLGAAVRAFTSKQPQARPNEPPMPTARLRPPVAGSVALGLAAEVVQGTAARRQSRLV